MHIAILGTGKMGGTVGRRLASAGHKIIYGSRDPNGNSHRFADYPNISVKSYVVASKEGEMAIIAVPWAFALDLVGSLKDELGGKIVVDLTNPLAPDASHLVVGGADSAAEQIARTLAHSKVVKAFNGITADNFANPRFSGEVAQVFYCGDDGDSKAIVHTLIESCGYQGKECGALSNARYLEAIAMLWLQLAFWEDWGGSFGFKIVATDTPLR
ncbi:MAG: NADPH-dependent F420 reductase [Pseudomonadota bacterium]